MKQILGGCMLGAACAAATVSVARDCPAHTEWAELELVSVTVGGEPLQDVSVYEGEVSVESYGFGTLVVSWTDGDEAWVDTTFELVR